MFKFPVYQPNLSGNEASYVNECLATNWISSKGKYINRFEQEFCRFTDCGEAIALCNGTVALHIALLALGLNPGDEVLVPTLTYIASVNAIRYVGATPVFVDSLPSTWQMDPEDVADRVTSKTKAIIAVHLYGHPCDLSALTAIARKHNLFLVEDCAEALGSYYNGVHVGSFGDIATYSFYGNKTITTGEGGMVTTHRAEVARLCVRLKGQGLAGAREYWHDIVGYNYRMTNVCAAIGVAQLERARSILAHKRRVAQLYQQGLASTPYEVHQESANTTHSYWMVSLLVPPSISRDDLRKFLAARGVETRPVFYPVHTMPMYWAPEASEFPVATNLARRGLNLPSYPELKAEDIEYICRLLEEYLVVSCKA